MLERVRTRTWIVALLAAAAAAYGCDGSGGGGGAAPEAGAAAQSLGCPGASGCDVPLVGVYVVGSSYSWDALPRALDDAPAWHIYCAKSLDYILDFPNAHCVNDSTPWPDLLEPPSRSFAHISFQPVKASTSTLASDVAAIGHWLAEQPTGTVAVLHTTWPEPAYWEEDLHDPAPDDTGTNYSMSYFYVLKEELARVHPDRSFVLTRANEMLDYIFHDPQAPILFSDLFRDAGGHMSHGAGRYLQHNALRKAMGQPTGVDRTVNGVPAAIRAYLDRVVDLH